MQNKILKAMKNSSYILKFFKLKGVKVYLFGITEIPSLV